MSFAAPSWSGAARSRGDDALRASRLRRPALTRPLPPAANQGMVEAQADRPRVECTHDAGIAVELLAVAFAFLIEERVEVGAFVTSGLEIDDPAHATDHEGAVDGDVRDGAGIDACQRPFAVCLGVLRRE